jgi:hypothetical protein
MTFKLFIDDERFPVDESFVIARTSQEAIQLVRSRGMPSEISFDHDLGGEDTAMVFLRWLTDQLIDGAVAFPDNFQFSVHSQNSVGVQNIQGLMAGLLKHFPPK